MATLEETGRTGPEGMANGKTGTKLPPPGGSDWAAILGAVSHKQLRRDYMSEIDFTAGLFKLISYPKRLTL